MLTKTETGLFLENSFLRIEINLENGWFNPRRIESLDGVIWADQPQQFAFDFRAKGGHVLRCKKLRYRSHLQQTTETGERLIVDTECAFEPTCETIQVIARIIYTLAPNQAVFTEVVEIEAIAVEPVLLHRAAMVWNLEGRDDVGFLPIPFGESHASVAPTLLTDASSGKRLNRDGAILFDRDGNNLVIAKTPSDRDPEYVVIESWKNVIRYSGFRPELAFNDCAQWMVNNRYESSPTRFEIVRGPVEKAFNAYRLFMNSHGIGLPENYEPRLNYCIYYECKNDWQRDKAAQLFPVAADLGCTLLYTDQGWETSFGSGVWDDARLGSCSEFVTEARGHGIEVGVLVSLHAKQPSWPAEVYRRDPMGAIEDGDCWHAFGICAGSALWQNEKTNKLAKLVEAGVQFFSFDFNDCRAYAGFNFRPYVCHSTEHGHSVPMSQWAHVTAVARQQREFRARYPDAMVEAHDWALAGDSALPMYLFPDSCQERWGFEYMWNPLADFQKGRLHNLYYYNLAYSLPLYLHMDLAKDNGHCVAFWYLASTIRHLGIGNFTALSTEQKVRVQSAMALYLQYRKYFTQGLFLGLSKLVHIHSLPKSGALFLLFNDTDQPMDHKICAPLHDFALTDQVVAVPILGSLSQHAVENCQLSASANVPPWGVVAFLVHSAA